jgi:hypothetical protein
MPTDERLEKIADNLCDLKNVPAEAFSERINEITGPLTPTDRDALATVFRDRGGTDKFAVSVENYFWFLFHRWEGHTDPASRSLPSLQELHPDWQLSFIRSGRSLGLIDPTGPPTDRELEEQCRERAGARKGNLQEFADRLYALDNVPTQEFGELLGRLEFDEDDYEALLRTFRKDANEPGVKGLRASFFESLWEVRRAMVKDDERPLRFTELPMLHQVTYLAWGQSLGLIEKAPPDPEDEAEDD